MDSKSIFLQPMARMLGNLAARFGVALHRVLLEVTAAYEAFHTDNYDDLSEEDIAAADAEHEAQVEEAIAAAASARPAQIVGPHYQLIVAPDIADKLSGAGLIVDCGGTHFHPNLPDGVHPHAHERMRVRIEDFITGLRN